MPKAFLDRVWLRHPQIEERRDKTGLLLELAGSAVGIRLAVLDLARTDVPDAITGAMEDEELRAAVDVDPGLAILARQALTFR
jgi:hypothetical protein